MNMAYNSSSANFETACYTFEDRFRSQFAFAKSAMSTVQWRARCDEFVIVFPYG